MDALAANLSQVVLTMDAPTILFPNPVANNFFDLPYPVQRGIVDALAQGNILQVDIIKDQGPFKLECSETALQCLPAVSKAFRQLAEPIIAANVVPIVRDLTTLAAMDQNEPGTVLPSAYESLPTKLFPAYLMRGVKSLSIRYAQVQTLDPVPKFDFSEFPSLEQLSFHNYDPLKILVDTAFSLLHLPAPEQFAKAFMICKSIGVGFCDPNQGPAAEMTAARDLAFQVGGPTQLLLFAATRIRDKLANVSVLERVLFTITKELCQFQRDKVVGVGDHVNIAVTFSTPCFPIISVRKSILSLLSHTQTDFEQAGWIELGSTDETTRVYIDKNDLKKYSKLPLGIWFPG